MYFNVFGEKVFRARFKDPGRMPVSLKMFPMMASLMR
jgi:hypothetical protein